MKNQAMENLNKALSLLWTEVRELFTEHHFITIVCGFFVVLMVLSFYRFLRSISPALVGLVMVLLVTILMLHWTQTRTEPKFLRPVVNYIAPYVNAPQYKQ